MKWGQGHRLWRITLVGVPASWLTRMKSGLVGGQHEHRDVLTPRGDDRLGDLGHADGLGAGEAAAARHHIEGQPGGGPATPGVPKRAVLEGDTEGQPVTDGPSCVTWPARL